MPISPAGALDYLVGFSPVPGIVAQAARIALRRARAIGSFASRLRPRARDRDIRGRGEYWSLVATLATQGTVRSSRRGWSARTQEDHPARYRHWRGGRGLQARISTLPVSRVAKVEAKPAKRHPQPPFTHLDAAAGGLPASSDGPRAQTHAASRSGCMREPRSAARTVGLSPICEPTAWTWIPAPFRPRAG